MHGREAHEVAAWTLTMIIRSLQKEAGDAHILQQNLVVGPHNRTHISDVGTTLVRAGSSAQPLCKPKEHREGV